MKINSSKYENKELKISEKMEEIMSRRNGK